MPINAAKFIMQNFAFQHQVPLKAAGGESSRPAVVLTTVSMTIWGDADGYLIKVCSLVSPGASKVDPGAVTAAIKVDSEIGKSWDEQGMDCILETSGAIIPVSS